MSGPLRIAAFAALLGVVFAASLLAGGAVDPDGPEESAADHEMAAEPSQDGPRGLAVSDHGLTLELDRDTLPLGRRASLAFRVTDEEGVAVRDFDLEHERRMHLIVVRRDLTGYRHLHPRQTADGSWQSAARFGEPGSYRVFADFSRGGEPVTLAADLDVAGRYSPRPLPEPSEAVALPDGYRVALTADGGELEFAVTRAGRPVADIQPYLGARGHLVALRDGDLAFLHVHPDEHRLAFQVEYPSAGRYRLFLQFRHRGRIHTAAFTQEVRDAGGH